MGAGLMGRWHAQTARRLGLEIAGIVDRDESAAERLAGSIVGAESFASIEELFRARSPDVIHICTPLDSHGSLALAALDHGAHVICEKPLAQSAAEVRALHEHAREVDRRICPVHQFASQRGVRRAKRLLDRVGTVRHASFDICSAGAEGAGAAEKDAVVADILPHPFSVISCLWPGASLEQLEWRCTRPAPGEVSALGTLEGMSLSLAVSMSSRPTRCNLEIQGDKGRILIDFFHGFCVFTPGRVSRFRKIVYPFSDSARLFSHAASNLALRAWRREPAYPGLRDLLRDFYLAIETGGDGPVSAEVSIAAALARDRFLERLRGEQVADTRESAP